MEEIAFGLLGGALAALAYLIWVTVRRRLWELDRTVVAVTPNGDRYVLEVPGIQLRTPMSRFLLRAPRKRETGDAQAARSHGDSADRLHPDEMFGHEEALAFAGPILLAIVVVLTAIFLIELLLALVVGVAAVAIGFIMRHRWRVRSPARTVRCGYIVPASCVAFAGSGTTSPLRFALAISPESLPVRSTSGRSRLMLLAR